MDREKLESILSDAQHRLFRSTVFCCDLPGVRESLGETLSDIVRERGNEKILDFSDLIPGLERYHDFQLMIWQRTIQASPWNGYTLMLDSKDAIGRWPEHTRCAAWKLLSGLLYCGTVIVVSSVEPTEQDEFRRIGYLETNGDFENFPYYQSIHDHTIYPIEELARI